MLRGYYIIYNTIELLSNRSLPVNDVLKYSGNDAIQMFQTYAGKQSVNWLTVCIHSSKLMDQEQLWSTLYKK